MATPAGYARQVSALRQGLQERGYTEGTNLVLDERWTGGDAARRPELAAELLRLVLLLRGSAVNASVMQAVGTTVASATGAGC